MNIIDLDGCISDDRWRRARIKDAGWPVYHALCDLDKLINAQVVWPHLTDFVIITGRPEAFREKTEIWLAKQKLPAPRAIFMRTDHRPSVEIKREQLHKLQMYQHKIEYAFDDRLDICEMYKREGVQHVYRLTAKGKCREIT
jgi:Leu/Phe-tRNA-protein transferase